MTLWEIMSAKGIRYNNPPNTLITEPSPSIHKIMVASFIVMGEAKDKMLQWNEVVILLNKTGKRSLRNRVLSVEVCKETPFLKSLLKVHCPR